MIFIFSGGMSAIYTAMNAVKKIFPDRKFCQFGFPYGDTLKLLENFNSKNTLFYPNADEMDLKQFEKIVFRKTQLLVYLPSFHLIHF